MTVVLALRCADGVVLGSDSQITDGARGLSYPAQKLHPFGDTAAWGGSGSRAVLYDLERLFDGNAAAVLGSENIGHAVQERVVPVLRRHYDQFVEQVPGEKPSGATPATDNDVIFRIERFGCGCLLARKRDGAEGRGGTAGTSYLQKIAPRSIRGFV